MSKVITVIAVLTDPQKAVFIDDKGERHTVQQTDPALAKLIHDIMPLLLADQKEAQRLNRPQKGVKIDLTNYSMFADFTEKTGGLVKFFRAAKAKVAAIVEYITGSNDDSTADEDSDAYLAQEAVKEKAVADTLAEAVTADAEANPVSAPKPVQRPRYEDVKAHLQPVVSDAPLPENETLVAVIGDVVIPGIDALKPYISHALKNNSKKAVTAFLERIARAIDKKGHTIPDLMKFIELGDLPLAEDGSIIAYKILNRTTTYGKYTYVDCHSNRVHQRVGTYVRIPEKMVDPDRRNDCSHGLHIARRGYLGSFNGNVCVLIKMAPEDVVAVPEYNANKVRVCGYHIIGELSKHVFDVLRSGKGMASDPEAAALLQKAISGDHIGVLEEVWINGSMGQDLEVKKELDDGSASKAIKDDEAKKVEASKNATNIDPTTAVIKAEPIDPRDLNKQIKEEEAKQAISNKSVIQVQYDEVLRQNNKALAQVLMSQKKKAKKSWEKLGLPTDTGVKLQAIIDAAVPVATATGTGTKAAKKAAVESVKPRGKEEPVKAEPKKTHPIEAKNDAEALFIESKWAELWAMKRKKKKSWQSFGFSDPEIQEIEKHKP